MIGQYYEVNYEVIHKARIMLSCQKDYKLYVNNGYADAYVVHKNQIAHECVYNMIDYMINIKKDQDYKESRTKKR